MGAAAGSPAGSGPSLRALAPRVVDGDTLVLGDGERVRLPAIDTPERGRPFADRATRALEALVGDGPIVLLPDPAPRDRYGRLLADVRVGGLDASAVLVGAGLAWIYTGDDAELLRLQARAVEAGVGVHGRIAGWTEPVVVTGRRFHRGRCQVLRPAPGRLVTTDVASLFKSGHAPCRTCLRWPP